MFEFKQKKKNNLQQGSQEFGYSLYKLDVSEEKNQRNYFDRNIPQQIKRRNTFM